MADQSFNIDDPGNVSSFLTLMYGSQASAKPGPSTGEDLVSLASKVEVADNNVVVGLEYSVVVNLDHPSPSKTKQAQDPDSSSQHVKATPADGVVPNTEVTTIEPIEAVEIALLRTIANSTLNLNDSKYAPKNYKKVRATNPEIKAATTPTPTRGATATMTFRNMFNPLSADQTEDSPSNKSAQREVITKFLTDQSRQGAYSSLLHQTSLLTIPQQLKRQLKQRPPSLPA
jgi:hypothetical protein